MLSRQDYHWQHEAVLYGWNPAGAHRWFGDRTQSTLIDDELDPNELTKSELADLVRELRNALGTTVTREARSRDSSMHPTLKPVRLVRRHVENTSKRGEVVYDPFAGSGTTLIAAAETGRRALAMELDPAYVDVIRTRWEEYSRGG